jgi:type IV pilus assembly protein PilB
MGMRRKPRGEALDDFASMIEARLATTDAPEPVAGVAVDVMSIDDEPEPLRRPLGEILVDRGAITSADVDAALAVQQSSDLRLGEILLQLDLLLPQVVVDALASQRGLRVVDLRRIAPEADAIASLPESVARKLHVLPLRKTATGLDVAVADPDIEAQLRDEAHLDVRLFLAPETEIDQGIEQFYKSTEQVGDAVRAFESLQAARGPEEAVVRAVVDANAPIVQVVNLILDQAVRDRASDVHVEPTADLVRIRNRKDGALHTVLELPATMGLSLVSRLKIMADLNIVERRRPQDGQFEIHVSGRDLDVRLSTTPTVYGEKAVMRLLDKSRALLHLGELGMPPETEERYKRLISSPYGMVICAGPTGSGKTTTLYASLMEINREEINVMTIEDPVEYLFPNLNQIQINEQAGVTFATGLRSILRQDPDTILVGEIRDVETARIAVQSALTGHFVLSSLHATDSIAALHRFLDMGIESFLIASSLLGVVAQRLVRRICPYCKVPYTPTDEELAFYERAEGPEIDEFFHGEGCNFCDQTGYLDRIGVYEVLRVSDDVRRLIIENAPNDVIRNVAVKNGMRSLANEAAALVGAGTTTISEVFRTIFVAESGD